MSPRVSPAVEELRRNQASDLFRQGLAIDQIAYKLRVHRRTVLRWLGSSRAKQGALSRHQMKHLEKMLKKGRKALGLPPGIWKDEEVQRLVSFVFDIRLRTESVRAILKRLGIT